MRIEYQLSREDYVQFYLYHHKRWMARVRRSWWYPPCVLLKWLAITGATFSFAYFMWRVLFRWTDVKPPNDDDNRNDLVIAGVITTICLPIFASLLRAAKPKRSLSWANLKVDLFAGLKQLLIDYWVQLCLEPTEVLLTFRKKWTENGVNNSVHCEYRVPWIEVQSIEECDFHAFIFTRALLGIFIPKAAFADIVAFRHFVDLSRRLWAGEPMTAITASVPSSPESAISSKRLP